MNCYYQARAYRAVDVLPGHMVQWMYANEVFNQMYRDAVINPMYRNKMF